MIINKIVPVQLSGSGYDVSRLTIVDTSMISKARHELNPYAKYLHELEDSESSTIDKSLVSKGWWHRNIIILCLGPNIQKTVKEVAHAIHTSTPHNTI